MKKLNKVLSGTLALAMSASMMFSSVTSAASLANWDTIRTDFTKVMLAPGADESQLNFAWYSTENAKPTVQIVKANEDFDSAGMFSGTSSVAYNSSETGTQYYSNKVTATGLEADTAYKYRYKTGDGEWSETYSYNTQAPMTDSDLSQWGDVQIGVGTAVPRTIPKDGRTPLILQPKKCPTQALLCQWATRLTEQRRRPVRRFFCIPNS